MAKLPPIATRYTIINGVECLTILGTSPLMIVVGDIVDTPMAATVTAVLTGLCKPSEWRKYSPPRKPVKPKYPFVLCGSKSDVWLSMLADGSRMEASEEIRRHYLSLLEAVPEFTTAS